MKINVSTVSGRTYFEMNTGLTYSTSLHLSLSLSNTCGLAWSMSFKPIVDCLGWFSCLVSFCCKYLDLVL